VREDAAAVGITPTALYLARTHRLNVRLRRADGRGARYFWELI